MDLHVLYSFPHRLGTPGIGTTAWHEVSGLAALGARVTLFCGTCDRPVPQVRQVIETMKLAGLRIPYRVLGNDRVFRAHDAKVATFLARTRDLPDVVHGWPLGALQTLGAARQRGVISVLERPNTHTAFAYDVVQKEFEKLGMRVPPSNTHAFNAKRLAREEAEYNLADYLACPSEFVAQTFRDRGFAESKIVVHRYGYDPSVCFPCERAAEGNPKLRIAFVGTCEPRKGLHYALDAWISSGAAAQGEFYICGKFVPEYREFLGTRLEHPSVRVLGFVSDVPALLRRCDVLMLPSIEEGSALVTYEARACGCVLLVSDATGARCKHDHDALIHRAGDVATLAGHLKALAAQPGLLARLRANSLDGVAELSWDSAADRLRQVYEAAISASSHRATGARR